MKKLKITDINVGFAASTGSDAESWPCLLIGKHTEKKLRSYMTYVVEALIAKKEKGGILNTKTKNLGILYIILLDSFLTNFFSWG